MAAPRKTQIRYVDIAIPGDMTAEIIKFHANQTEVGKAFQQFLTEGHRPTFSIDKERGRVSVVAYAPDTSVNRNCALKANGVDWYSAIVSLCFKHYRLCGGGQWEKTDEEESTLFG